jgi:hypothetical protein
VASPGMGGPAFHDLKAYQTVAIFPSCRQVQSDEWERLPICRAFARSQRVGVRGGQDVALVAS